MADGISPRWAQLTYASFDDGRGAGGWQVKQTTGEPTNEEIAHLRARVVTAFDCHLSLPQFPSSDELAALPRRFSYSPQDDGSAIYLHAVQSGDDSTGRPGNVFSHAVLDRRPDEALPQLHPIQLWRSPGLLVPFGASKVLNAEFLATAYPGPGSMVSLDSAISFILDSDTWRVGLLCVLLDALAASLAGGPRVVFVSNSTDSAALWLGAASYLTSPATTRTLAWSLYERASGLEAALSRGFHFVAVPDIDLDLVKATPGVVVIHESETPTLGALDGGPHRTAAGSSVTVTEWSEIAQMVLIDPDVAHRILATIPDVVHGVGDHGLHIAWPLAMSVAIIREDVEDALPYASSVILESSPPSIRANSFLFARAAEVANLGAGGTAAELWTRLQRVDRHPTTLGYDLLVGPYLERTLVDRTWMTQPGGCPLPNRIPELESGAALRLIAESALRTAFDEGDSSLDGAVFHLRLVDVVITAGLLTQNEPAFSPLLHIATGLLGRTASVRLSDPAMGPELIAQVGQVSAALRALLQDIAQDWPVWETDAVAPGHRLDPRVLSWLFQGALLPAALSAGGHAAMHAPGFELERALWLDGHGDTSPGLWAVIASGLLAWHHEWGAIPDARRRLLLSRPRTVGELALVEERYAGQLPEVYFIRTLASSEWNDDVQRLCLALGRSHPSLPSRRFAVLRNACAGVLTGNSTDQLSPGTVMASAISLFTVAPDDVNWDEIGPVILTILVLALEAGNPNNIPEPSNHMIRSAAHGGVGTSGTVNAAIVLLLSDLDRAPLSGTKLSRSAILALTTAPGFPVAMATSAAMTLGRVESVGTAGSVRLVEARLRHTIARGTGESLDAVVTHVRQALVARLRSQGYTDDRKYQFDVKRVDEFSRAWWLSVGLPSAQSRTSGDAVQDPDTTSREPRRSSPFGHILEGKKDR